MESDFIKQMLDRVGPDMPQITEIEQSGESEWVVVFDDGTGVIVEAMQSRLALSAAIGRPPIDRRFVVYESLLSFNALWRETDGARLALNGPNGDVMLVHEISAVELTSSGLQDALARFAELVALWRDYVTAEPEKFDLPMPQSTMLGKFA